MGGWPPRRSRQQVPAGEGSEGGQDGLAGFTGEAGQAQAVAARALQQAGRVQVAGQHVVREMWLGVVAAGERAEQPGFFHHFNAGLGRRVAGAVVVVAAH